MSTIRMSNAERVVAQRKTVRERARVITEGLKKRNISCECLDYEKAGVLYVTPKTGLMNEQVGRAIEEIMPDVPVFSGHEQIAGPRGGHHTLQRFGLQGLRMTKIRKGCWRNMR
jgi:hypothetical protein